MIKRRYNINNFKTKLKNSLLTQFIKINHYILMKNYQGSPGEDFDYNLNLTKNEERKFLMTRF